MKISIFVSLFVRIVLEKSFLMQVISTFPLQPPLFQVLNSPKWPEAAHRWLVPGYRPLSTHWSKPTGFWHIIGPDYILTFPLVEKPYPLIGWTTCSRKEKKKYTNTSDLSVKWKKSSESN